MLLIPDVVMFLFFGKFAYDAMNSVDKLQYYLQLFYLFIFLLFFIYYYRKAFTFDILEIWNEAVAGVYAQVPKDTGILLFNLHYISLYFF